MELIVEQKELYLKLGDRKISGLINNSNDLYFGCRYLFESNDDFSINDLSVYSPSEIPEGTCFHDAYDSQYCKQVTGAQVGKRKGMMHFDIYASYWLEDWDDSINLKLFFPELVKTLEVDGKYKFESFSERDHFEISLVFETDELVSISEQCECACKYLREKHDFVLDNLDIEGRFISQFNFPLEYKSAFVQYLTYFGQFLEDLGISGDFSISSKNENTSIAFHPASKDVALDNIALALETYLSLPSSEGLSIVTSRDTLEAEVKIQQLVSVIEHMKSQLSLSKAIVSAKDREISFLEKETISSKREVSQNIADYWEPIEGVKITSYEGKFFTLDIPHLIGKVKNWGKKS